MIIAIILWSVGAILGIYLLSGLRIIQEWEEGHLFTFGSYIRKKDHGLHWILPGVQALISIDTRIMTLDVEPQKCVTSDGVTVDLDAVIYYKVTNSKKAIVDVKNFEKASFKFGQTALKDVVGEKTLDELLQKKKMIGEEIKKKIQDPTDRFGVNISNVEIKEVKLPANMERAMAKEAEAIREKRARLIKAEGEFEASKKLKEASKNMPDNAMRLRQLQTMQEIGAEQNSTMIFVPSDLIGNIGNLLKKN